ncbi:RNA-binding protein [Methanobacterium petrolearium]|uniref:RNA-binding protein n=1 Tax=Methanobacterium petrolearium TaxID=710190 RepID=UPI001AEA7723|nr:RNA-binding protein [Methanobacterium petrolearium]MBP1946077.1 RNA binding exosome subunit [Methanobacterium petrolearium]
MIHNLSYRAFVYSTESEEKVREAICTLLPTALPEKEVTEGYHNNPVIILHGKITKKREINDFLEKLRSLKPSVKKKILKELHNRMDDKGNLFLRFDKQCAYLGDLKMVEHGDALHLKLKIAAYPARKEIALEVAQKIFEE